MKNIVSQEKMELTGYYMEEIKKEEKKMERVPTELEWLNSIVNYVEKEEEMEKMEIIKEEAENIRLEEIERQKEHAQKEAEVADKETEEWAEEVFNKPIFGKEKPKLVYNKKHKVWMEEGAVFRQATNQEFRNERVRIKSHLEKLADTVYSNPYGDKETRYQYKDRKVFLAIFKNLLKGGYEICVKNDEVITLRKDWYSYGMRSNNIQYLVFEKWGDVYQITEYRDRKQMNDYAKRMRYGWKMTPIGKVENKYN